jgi:hypothetical protein
MKAILLSAIVLSILSFYTPAHADIVDNNCYTVQPLLDQPGGNDGFFVCRINSFVNPLGVALVRKNQTSSGWCNWKVTRNTVDNYWRLQQTTLYPYVMYLGSTYIAGTWRRQFAASTDAAEVYNRWTLSTIGSNMYTFIPKWNASNVMVRDGIFAGPNPIHRELTFYEAYNYQVDMSNLYLHQFTSVPC